MQAQGQVAVLQGCVQMKSLSRPMDPLAVVRGNLGAVVQHLQAEKLDPTALRAAADSLQASAGVLGAGGLGTG